MYRPVPPSGQALLRRRRPGVQGGSTRERSERAVRTRRLGGQDGGQFGDGTASPPPLDRVLGRTHSGPAPVRQKGGRLLPLLALQDPSRRVESAQRSVSILPPGDDHQVLGLGEAGNRLLLQARLLRGQHVDLAVPVGEPGRDVTSRPSYSTPTQMTSDFFSPSSISLSNFSGAAWSTTWNSVWPSTSPSRRKE